MNYEDLKQKLDKIKIVDVLVNNAGTNIPEPVSYTHLTLPTTPYV